MKSQPEVKNDRKRLIQQEKLFSILVLPSLLSILNVTSTHYVLWQSFIFASLNNNFSRWLMRNSLFHIPLIGQIDKNCRRRKTMGKPLKCWSRSEILYISCKPIACVSIVIGKIAECKYTGDIRFAPEPLGLELHVISLELAVLLRGGIWAEIIIIDIDCKLAWRSVTPQPDPSVFINKLGNSGDLYHPYSLWLVIEVSKRI